MKFIPSNFAILCLAFVLHILISRSFSRKTLHLDYFISLNFNSLHETFPISIFVWMVCWTDKHHRSRATSTSFRGPQSLLCYGVALSDFSTLILPSSVLSMPDPQAHQDLHSYNTTFTSRLFFIPLPSITGFYLVLPIPLHMLPSLLSSNTHL